MALEIPDRFNLTQYFLDRPAAEHPQRIAIVGEPEIVRYGELARVTNRVGNALGAGGVTVGDRLLIALPDSAEFMAAFFGAAKIGAIAVPVNSMTRASDYVYYLSDCGARAAIVHSTALAEFLPATAKASLDLLVVVGRVPKSAVPGKFLEWRDWTASGSPHLEPHPTAATDAAFLLYTSGSGGQPKAAIHEHKDMLACSRCFARDILEIRSDDRTFSVSKLFFAYGLGNGMYFPLSVGASTLLNPDRPKVEQVIAMVARHRPTIFFAVPTFYAALLRELDRGTSVDFSSVRSAVSAGEALPAEIFEQFRKKLGTEILDAIGSTEMLHMFLSNRPGKARPGSCGYELAHYQAKIVDDAGQTVPTGEIGNLWVKGQAAFRGYWNKPELTARSKRDDWVVTGDKFFRDADGYYHYCGRADDMMKVAGMWVSPGEVENALLGHPAVAEAAVVAARDAAGLTKPVAYVVLRAGHTSNSSVGQQIQEFVRQRLAGYKCPQEVCFLDELPKTATGKIQRFRLRAP